MSLELLKQNIYDPKKKYIGIYLELELQKQNEIDGLINLYIKEKCLCKDVVKYIIFPMLNEDTEKKFNSIVNDLEELEKVCQKFPCDNETKIKMYQEIREHHGLK